MNELAPSPRERIAALVQSEPGLHLREIPRRLDLSLASVRHHLRALRDLGAIVAERRSGYVRFFPAAQFSPGERALLGCARVAGQRRLMEALLREGPLLFEEARARTGLSKGSLHWHMKVLCAAQVAGAREDGRLGLCDRGAAAMALALTRPSAAANLGDAAIEIFDPPS